MIYLGPALQYIISKINIEVCYSYHVPMQKQLVINLVDYLPTLKSGLCQEGTLFHILNTYINLMNKSHPSQIDIFNDAFGGDIKIGGATDINTFQFRIKMDPTFDADHYDYTVLTDLIRYNFHESEDLIKEENISSLTNESNIASQIYVMFRHGYSLDILKELINELTFRYDTDELLDQLQNDSKFKLYTAIIRFDEERIVECLKTSDPRNDDNNALYLVDDILLKCAIDQDCNTMKKILNLIRNDIITRNWHEKQVLIKNIELLIGFSDIPDNLYNYMKILL